MNKATRLFIKENLRMVRCRYCYRSADETKMTIDHKKPRIKGGGDHLGNLQCLCNKCNLRKSQTTDRELKFLWKWFIEIQSSRAERGKKFLFKKKMKELIDKEYKLKQEI